jgi:predicted transcriptional regulator
MSELCNNPYFALIWVLVGAVFVFAFGFLFGCKLFKSEIDAIADERDDLEQLVKVQQQTLNSDSKLIKRLSAEAEINRNDAQRYALVRYYIENDHGGLAIEAFFGPQAIVRSNALDAILDEELDRRYLMSND